MRYIFGMLALVAMTSVAAAQDDPSWFAIGGDVYGAGQNVVQDRPEAGNLFMAGEDLRSVTPATGSAHLIGRWITVEDDIAQNLYAAGQKITLRANIGGDVSLAAMEIMTSGDIGGSARLFASDLRIDGPIAGYVVASGEDVQVNAPVAGDMVLAARTVSFGPDAVIAGKLMLYEDEPGDLDVPERVIAAARIERHRLAEWDSDRGDYEIVSARAVIGAFLAGVLTITLAAALIAAVFPKVMADLRRRVLEQPWSTLAMGFVTQSALIGAGVLLALTVIGLLLTPAAIFMALLAGFLGYVVGAYALGVRLLAATGRDDPTDTADRALAAGVGALIAGLIGLVPFLGWIFVLALSLAGTGAISNRMLRPAFFT